ncbi:hypothetical protein LCGC14_2856540 [marine sediment metagenome]|uniref:Uncharacterized protein n=1 Tax=marine sediment metagenome TaxID=412755 RepID=A0A0F9AXS9_9ZZZZ
MRFHLANWAFRLWCWLEPRSPESTQHPIRSKEYADITRGERYLLYRSLATQPGFLMLMDELDYFKSIWERKAHDLPSSVADNTPAESVKIQAVRIHEVTFWIGWIQRKVSQATHHKFPVPTSTAAKNTDAPGLRGQNQKK